MERVLEEGNVLHGWFHDTAREARGCNCNVGSGGVIEIAQVPNEGLKG